ncbi:MAG: hypothetical protein V4736_12065 [Bdellovibrionota bacterium]
MKTGMVLKQALKLTILALVAGSVFSCAQTKRERLKGTTTASVRSGGEVQTCGNGESSAGMIYDNGQLPTPYRTAVQQFISSWMNYNLLGTIDGSPNSTKTGIDFTGKFTFNSSGALVPTSSNFKIAIIDSYYGQSNGSGGTFGAITVNFDQAKLASANCRGTLTGQKTSATTFKVIADDCAGSIAIEGQINGTYVDGRVSFINKQSSMNFVGQTGTLGALRIATCGIL